jgi:hypothetical protein
VSGQGRVIAVDKVSDQDVKPALRLTTDAPQVARCVLIERQEPHPEIGDTISWGPHHVVWKGQKLRKIGWEFG